MTTIPMGLVHTVLVTFQSGDGVLLMQKYERHPSGGMACVPQWSVVLPNDVADRIRHSGDEILQNFSQMTAERMTIQTDGSAILWQRHSDQVEGGWCIEGETVQRLKDRVHAGTTVLELEIDIETDEEDDYGN